MALGIVIDGRRVRDFGIGTYIRSLIHALSRIDTANHYTVVTGPGEARVWGPLPENFRIALYAGDDHTDVDAFAGLRDVVGAGAVCVGVRSEETPAQLEAAADFMVDGPAGVRELLELLVR